MQTKILFFISICVLSINGCATYPHISGKVSGAKINDSKWFITSESIENIVRDQFVPVKVRQIKGETIVIFLKEDVCPCVEYIELRMKVSEVNSRGIKGYEKHFSSRYIVDSEQCKTFATANDIIIEAEKSSRNWPNFFPPSYNLIWEAQRALGPPECDSIRAKILAEKAKQLAEDEGAKPLGYDITGTWISEITSNHPDYFSKKEQRNLKLRIDERGTQITATDSSGEATLKAYRNEEFQYPTSIKFKFSFPLVSINQLEGDWEVTDGSTIEGSWNDPITSASGEWNMRKTGQKIKAEELRKYSPKHLQRWLSQKPPLEIKWEEIDEIHVWGLEEGDIDWEWCWMLGGEGDCFDIGY